MHCEHQIPVGNPCPNCRNGVAVVPKRKRSTSPVRPPIAPPSPIAMTPVSPPALVGGLHTALAANAASAAGGGSADADPLNSTTAVNVLNAIVQALPEPDPTVTLTTDACNTGAVCWNWVLAGGANAAAEDPSWAFLYVTREQAGAIPNASGEVKADLDAARAVLHAPKSLTKARSDQIYTHILQGLIKHYHLREQANSNLKLVFYYDPTKVKTGLMYLHFEFEYQTITITKGLGEKLKAFHGVSKLPWVVRKPVRLVFAIDPNSLSQTHIEVLRSLIADLAPAQHIAKKTRRDER